MGDNCQVSPQKARITILHEREFQRSHSYIHYAIVICFATVVFIQKNLFNSEKFLSRFYFHFQTVLRLLNLLLSFLVSLFYSIIRVL